MHVETMLDRIEHGTFPKPRIAILPMVQGTCLVLIEAAGFAASTLLTVLGLPLFVHLRERDADKGEAIGAYTDALMFIESIPARETRIFIERVLSNLWMYRERLGEPAPSLDALAAGERPVYIAVDGAEGSVAEDVWN